MYHVYVKRWFQKSYGNTYHSVRIYDDNELILHEPFTYGYGNHYETTTLHMLQKAGLFEKISNDNIKDQWNFTEYCRNNDGFLKYYVEDVNRKKDM